MSIIKGSREELNALLNLIDSVSKVIESTKTGDPADRYLIYEMKLALQEFIAQINKNPHDLWNLHKSNSNG